ncbi:hypothetical protein [Methylibium sp.]|uniref:hypothetical protein n=1 Tax=Methylibium sp. TaxID=2067992 RepID=UPI00286B9946|nr:hypothetical protein [Methylibium sp.]
MTLSLVTWQHLKPARNAALAGLSSVLRLAARGRRAGPAVPGWLDGLTRAMRSAGPARDARPLHAVLAGGDRAYGD